MAHQLAQVYINIHFYMMNILGEIYITPWREDSEGYWERSNMEEAKKSCPGWAFRCRASHRFINECTLGLSSNISNPMILSLGYIVIDDLHCGKSLWQIDARPQQSRQSKREEGQVRVRNVVLLLKAHGHKAASMFLRSNSRWAVAIYRCRNQNLH